MLCESCGFHFSQVSKMPVQCCTWTSWWIQIQSKLSFPECKQNSPCGGAQSPGGLSSSLHWVVGLAFMAEGVEGSNALLRLCHVKFVTRLWARILGWFKVRGWTWPSLAVGQNWMFQDRHADSGCSAALLWHFAGKFLVERFQVGWTGEVLVLLQGCLGLVLQWATARL